MTPRTLDVESMQAKLRMMRRMRTRLVEMGRVDRERLAEDWDLQLVAERLLTGLVDLAIAINTHLVVVERGEAPYDYSESFALVARAGVIDKSLARQLSPSVQFRNVVIHAYLDLDLDRFVAAIPLGIEQYGEYIEQVAGYLRKREDQNRSGGR
jgi:uncharacterized protein YutE (UPF0331/DUF86 family)